ncbi:hypothetical protein G7046_g7047 [Stylonectria norvegica]|nr:hypothetical protein G7046_g7047 [Stylonectria norvegica]
MTSLLSSKQAEELHKSIIAYLLANGQSNAAAVLRQEANFREDIFDAVTARKYEFLLEKKWTSVIMDLETRTQILQSELDNTTPTSLSRRNDDPRSWLPTALPRHTLASHRDTINCVAFHPVFSSIASGSDDYTIKIWDWDLGELEKTIKGHTRAVLDVDYGGTKGAYLLASCSSDLTIKLWDPSNVYRNIRTLTGHDHSVSAIRFIPLGAVGTLSSSSLLVSASRDKTLRIWDTTAGFCVRTINNQSGWVRDVCPSADGRFLLSTGDDMAVRLWDLSVLENEPKLTILDSWVEEASAGKFHCRVMATGSRDKSIRLWDTRGACIATLTGHDNWVRAVVFHPGGKYLLSVSDDKTLRCWDLSQGGKCIKVLTDAHERFITCLRWVPSTIKHNSNTPGLPKNEEDGKPKNNAAERPTPDIQMRCIIATGGVDQKLRIFAN